MNRSFPKRLFQIAGILVVACAASLTYAQDTDLSTPASWKPVDFETAKQRIQSALTDANEIAQAKVEAIWIRPAGDQAVDLLELAALSAAAMDEPTRSAISACERAPNLAKLESPQWAGLPDELADNVRLFYARWLVQNNLYDEALVHLKPIQLERVVDPSALLFYRAVVAHRLLNKSECVASTNLLLENAGKIPRRYEQLARMMTADIEPLKVDSPDEIARLMNDVERRLELGRAGERVRKREEEIVKKLDKLIEQIEKEMEKKKQQQQQPSSGNPSKPLDDSSPISQKGAGDVESKEQENRKRWGDLPPEERRSTLQQISRELGARYREVIEEYFRKIAQDSD